MFYSAHCPACDADPSGAVADYGTTAGVEAFWNDPWLLQIVSAQLEELQVSWHELLLQWRGILLQVYHFRGATTTPAVPMPSRPVQQIEPFHSPWGFLA